MANPVRVRGAGQIKKKDLIPFTRQMSGMLNAGMSIISAVSTLEEQNTSKLFKPILKGLRDSIESGSPFSDGLATYPQIFDAMYVNMVAAGEASGQFAPVLKRLAVMLDSSARLVRKVKSALTYPTVIMALAIIIALGLITFVVPVFAEMFSGFGKELPGPTQFLVNVGEWIKKYWYMLGIVIGGGVYAFKRWRGTTAGRYATDSAFLKIPVFGELVLKVSIGRFCRLNALDIVARSIGNAALEKSFLDARAGVEQGGTLSASLEGKPFLPILMVRMIAAGEKAGRVDEMLTSIADSYDEEVETMLGTLTSLMEPFLMVFLGVVIGSIVVAMFMPIFQMGSAVSG